LFAPLRRLRVCGLRLKNFVVRFGAYRLNQPKMPPQANCQGFAP